MMHHEQLGKGSQKKTANHPHFVDKRLVPPPYPRRPKLIIFKLRNFLFTLKDPPCPYPLFIKIYISFVLLFKGRVQLNPISLDRSTNTYFVIFLPGSGQLITTLLFSTGVRPTTRQFCDLNCQKTTL